MSKMDNDVIIHLYCKMGKIKFCCMGPKSHYTMLLFFDRDIKICGSIRVGND